MPSVLEVLQRLLPKGTDPRARSRRSWALPPTWPPDVFAVAGTLVSLSGCYAHPQVRGAVGLRKGHLSRVRPGHTACTLPSLNRDGDHSCSKPFFRVLPETGSARKTFRVV